MGWPRSCTRVILHSSSRGDGPTCITDETHLAKLRCAESIRSYSVLLNEHAVQNTQRSIMLPAIDHLALERHPVVCSTARQQQLLVPFVLLPLKPVSMAALRLVHITRAATAERIGEWPMARTEQLQHTSAPTKKIRVRLCLAEQRDDPTSW